MTKAALENLKRTVNSSLNLMILDKPGKVLGTGSGVIISYLERYFICTVEHNIDGNKNRIAILTGDREGDFEMSVQPPELSFLDEIELGDLTVSALQDALDNLDTARSLDIAFAEVQKLDKLIQEELSIVLRDNSYVEINDGAKQIVAIDQIPAIKKNAKYSFSGRIKTGYTKDNKFTYQQQLISGMKLVAMDQHMIKFDLGYPVGDSADFKGCSGAPIFDDKGMLVALVAWGDKNVSKPYVYGFRLDRLVRYIHMTYFFPGLDQSLALQGKGR